MTYPPQPPGPYGQQPGGYGQQPGQNPPTGGYPQQGGGYPQQGGYPPGAPGAPGGYPQTGGFPQQPGGYPQTGGFGAPGPYGQQPPGGYQPGYQPGQGPQKSKTPIILAGAGVLVVLLVIFVGGFAWPGFFTGGSSSSPTDLANSFISAVKSKDGTTIANLLCTKPTQQQMQQYSQFDDPNAADQVTINSISLAGDPTVSGTSATAQISVNETLPASLGGKTATNTLTLKMLQQNGDWCIDNNTFSAGAGANPSAEPSIPTMPTLPSGFPSVEPSFPSDDGGFGDSGDNGDGGDSDIPSYLPGDGSGG